MPTHGSAYPLMPYGRFDLSGYASDPGTPCLARSGLVPPQSPSALPPSEQVASSGQLNHMPPSPASSASSIVSLLSSASLPPNSNFSTNAPSANMISRLPSSAPGQPHTSSPYQTKLPTNPSRIATSSSIPQQLSSGQQCAIPSGLPLQSQANKRVSIPNRTNTSVPSSRSSSPGLGPPVSTTSQLSLSGPSPAATTSPTSQTSLPTSRLAKSIIPGPKALPASREPRPNSTSSIPQVGAFSNQAAKPTTVQYRSSRVSTAAGKQPSASSAIKSPPGDSTSTAGGPAPSFKSKHTATSPQGQSAPNVNSSKTASTTAKQRFGPAQTDSTTPNGSSTTKFSTQLSSLKAQSSSRIGSLSSLKRIPAGQQVSMKSDGTRSRPISTIIESNSSAIPSMVMASSSISSGSIGSGYNLSPQPSTSSITKPTATVKAMVTPIMSTNQLSSLKKRSPTEALKIAKLQQQQQQQPLPQSQQPPEESVKLSNENYKELSKSKENLIPDDASPSEENGASNQEQDPDSDSGSSQNSSDIENALASLEPMQPINLERQSMHNFSYLSKSQTNGQQMPPQQQQQQQQQSIYGNEDYSDNSESQTQVKAVVRQSSERDSPAKSSHPSRMTIPLSFNTNHLSDSTTLLNLHLRPSRASSLRLKNSKSQSEYGSNLFGFDETSSLSSDPGMVSGTDVSTGTTTSSSMCSSTDQRIYASKRPGYGGQSKSKSVTPTKLAFFDPEADSNRRSSSQTPKGSTGALNGSRKNSLASSNGDLSSSSAATPTNGTPKTSRPLSSPSSKNLVVHSGTLPLNGSSKMRAGCGSRYLNSSQSKLRAATLANGSASSEQVYSDSECVQQRSLMYRLAARGPGAGYPQLPPSIPAPQNYTGQSPANSPYGCKPKDGAIDFPQNVYSNTMEVYKMSPSHQPYLGRNAFTDTESVESLNLGGSSSDLGQPHSLYGHLQPQSAQHGNYSNFYPPPTHHLSKPGDLIYEYESINRGLRETMSASPTMMMANKMNGIGNGVEGTPSLGRSGSIRSTGSRNYAQFEPAGQGGELTNRPPIPAHMNKPTAQKLEDQSGQSGSSLSLLSTSSSMFAAPEEKYIHENRKLRRELDQANEKILNLTTQLTANAHMVAAFEQSLSSMTARLQQLSSSSEVKDCELDRLRKTIEILKQQGGSLVNGVKAGSRQLDPRKGSIPSDYTDGESPSNTLPKAPPPKSQRYHKASTNSLLIRRHTFNNALLHTSLNNYSTGDIYDSNKYQQRQLSTESVNSISSCGEPSKGKKKSKLKTLTGHNASWIRSSFSRAFKKNKPKDGSLNREIMSDAESGSESCRRPSSAAGIAPDSRSVPSSPLLSVRSFKTSTSSSSESKGTDANKSEASPEMVQNLHKQLREKEMQLTDMRLESLTSTHQMENLKEMLSQMRLEMATLKQDNDRLQRLVSHKSLASSASSLATSAHMAPMSAETSARNSNNLDANSLESVEIDVPSSAGSASDSATLKSVTLGSGSHTLARFGITSKTNWEQLDALVRKLFKEHLIRVDCNLSLGITVDSLACYRVGSEQIQRNLQELSLQQVPELLPFGYLVEESHINLQFKSALDSLAFDTLTPKSILSQFLGLLNENRRLILAGPSGTGKTYLGHKLAEYLVIQQQLTNPDESLSHFGSALTSGAIATFNVDHKNAKELRAYLSNIAEQCESLSQLVGDCPRSPMSGHLPIVIILDNLHHIDDSLVVDIFNRLNHEKSPFIIGTINQNVTSTQTISEMFHRFHFRMATFSVQTEPVKGFLTRYLRRKWLEAEAKMGKSNNSFDQQMGRIIDWIPRVSMYLNRFLDNFFPTQNIAIGPRLFTSCPIDPSGSQIWFTDLWNFSILPFITENLRDLLSKSRSSQGASCQQMYARLKEKFVDPTEWVIENYPWASSGNASEWLNALRLEDILEHGSLEQTGQRSGSSASGKFSAHGKPPVPISINDRIAQVNDPFLETLIKLKEATEVNNSSHESSK